jgi:UDP-glucuronate 4-epimerase
LATVYGPWDRPDAENVVLADAIAAGRPVMLAGHERETRQLVFATDAASAVLTALDRPPRAGGEGREPPHRTVWVGPDEPVGLGRLVAALGVALGREPVVEVTGMSAGAQEESAGTPMVARSGFDWRPETSLEEGLRRFAAWHVGRGVPK